MEKLEPHNCKIGIGECLHIIAGKWKPIILLLLQLEGTQRFSDLKRWIPGITQKMLTAQLKELEQEDLIQRTVYAEVPPRVEYSITEHGRTLEHILRQLNEWGIQHINYVNEKRVDQS
ncbi:winged helix-turn-helix transcriptional regulator [Paenibacillus oryzisoli]|uniref:HxlR family transcriptional regulator n=1 Tax=Paenibacillus oryzisoli TaxID=1850517 RepID=A0A198A6H7_9BACL|nr:helix-turn-helix domain-containing protein [Paenibacillus oryzisoli]OAS16747.1 HxlR family transcriptional regulator [Paenibacillus oryzisoli]